MAPVVQDKMTKVIFITVKVRDVGWYDETMKLQLRDNLQNTRVFLKRKD